MEIRRRRFLLLLTSTPLLAATAEPGSKLRGKLTKGPGDKPALQLANGQLVTLTGDDDTLGVLRDARLAGSDFEVIGKRNADGFAINPIYMAALYAYKDGQRLRVTYWCDVCAIRTYTPGLCWCCRQETALDLRDPDKVE
jgi:hypothetical protein